MRDETKMDVYTSGVTGAEYDAGMKQLMSNKEIIVPILQMTVPEFKTCSQEEILQCLDISSITKSYSLKTTPICKGTGTRLPVLLILQCIKDYPNLLGDENS